MLLRCQRCDVWKADEPRGMDYGSEPRPTGRLRAILHAGRGLSRRLPAATQAHNLIDQIYKAGVRAGAFPADLLEPQTLCA
jgi:hypothetical protein